MDKLRAVALLLGIAVATWKPCFSFGEPPVGRLDAWAIHGLGPSRIDGIDPVQVPLTAFVVLAAAAAFVRPTTLRPARVGATLLVFLLAARGLAHLHGGETPAAGLLGVPLLLVGALA